MIEKTNIIVGPKMGASSLSIIPTLQVVSLLGAGQGPEGGFKSRDEFIKTAKCHSSWYERLIPDILTIDERQKTVVVLFKTEVVGTKRNKVVVRKSAMAHYGLVLDENNTNKIKTIRFFWEVLLSGLPEFYDLFKDDP